MTDAMPSNSSPVERSVLLDHEVGLHARPSVKLTKLAKQFSASIDLRPGDHNDWTDAKSIVKVMALKARRGTVLQFRAEGDDAQFAVDALVDLVERNFDDGGG
jgi:phosphocarrier protein